MSELKATSIPFGVYDFLGYLMPGFLLIVILVFEYDMGKAITYYIDHDNSFKGIESHPELYKLPYLMKFLAWESAPGDFKILVPFFLLIIVCYLIGHVVSAISSSILEKGLLSSWLEFPDHNLFNRNTASKGWFKRRYTRPFDESFKQQFVKVIDKRFGYVVNVRDYYWMCYSDITRYLPTAYQRTQHFVNLYGFTRNTCATFLIYVIGRLFIKLVYLAIGVPYQLRFTNYLILGLYTAIASFLFFSYIKLFRRQTIELFFAFYAMHTPTATPIAPAAATTPSE